MKKIILIHSFTDVITNSSSETFLLSGNNIKELAEKYGVYIEEFTEESLRESAFEGYSFIYEAGLPDLYEIQTKMENLRTDDEIWQFFKPAFEPYIGKFYFSYETDNMRESLRNFMNAIKPEQYERL